MEDQQQPKTLKSLFAAAESKREALEGLPEASVPGYREALTAAIGEYEECVDLTSRLGLFSPNESADDIATGNLPYLLVEYHLADLVQKTPTASPAERRRILEAARRSYERFLHQLDGYGLLDGPRAKLLETYTDDPAGFSLAPGADAAARRQAKITNFREERDLRARLAQLRARKRPRNGDGGDDDDDDETARAAHLAHAALTVHSSFQALEGLNREASVLAAAPVPLLPQASSVEEDERERRRRGEPELPPLRRLRSALGPGGGPVLSPDGKPLQPFTLLSNRLSWRAACSGPATACPP